MQEDIDEFTEKFGILQSKGLPSPLVINDKLMRHEDISKNWISMQTVKPVHLHPKHYLQAEFSMIV